MRALLRAGLLLTLGALGACHPSAPRADLVLDNGAEPETLDPAQMTGQLEGRLAYALFEGLTAYNAAGKPEPGVAQSWDISPDGLVYTFHLRPNARWSDGSAVTAADFVRSWIRVLKPDTGAPYAYQLWRLKNARRFNDPASGLTDPNEVGVRALDPMTLEVTLEAPTSYFLDLCANKTLLPVPDPAVKRWGDSWIKPEHIVSNGAFILESWRLNDRIRLRKNPLYWDRDRVRLNTVDALPISQPNVALNFFVSGAVDLLMDKGLMPVTLMRELRRKPYFHSAPFLGTMFLRFNCSRPPFNDVRVRKAFALAINKSAITDKITLAGERPADSLVPPGAGGYEPAPTDLRRDPDRARGLLAEAGYPGGAGFPPVSFLYNEYDINRFIGIELQAMIAKELGIRISLRPQENKVYLKTMSTLDYDFARSSWIGDYDDPNTFLDIYISGGGNNRTGWGNPRYDDLIERAGREANGDRRFDLLRQSEHLLVSEDAAVCPLYFYVGIQLYDNARLGGIEPNVIDEHPIKTMYRVADQNAPR